MRLLETARETGVDTESMRRLLALAYRRDDRPARGWEVLSADADSPWPATHWMLARLAVDMGQFDEALRRFDRALELDPTMPLARLELGLLYLRRQQFEQAAEQLGQALVRLPDHARGWNALGVARVETGDVDGAIEAWRTSIRVDASYPDPLFNLALELAQRGDRNGAAEALTRYLPLVDGARRERAQRMLDQLHGRS
jgi:Flp pilus assembly protein TadD